MIQVILRGLSDLGQAGCLAIGLWAGMLVICIATAWCLQKVAPYQGDVTKINR